MIAVDMHHVGGRADQIKSADMRIHRTRPVSRAQQSPAVIKMHTCDGVITAIALAGS